MDDLISRQQALIDQLRWERDVAVRQLHDLGYEFGEEPSAQPEIIRCKDCKHRNRYRFPPQYDERDYCEKHEKVVREDCYCSWAERRTE